MKSAARLMALTAVAATWIMDGGGSSTPSAADVAPHPARLSPRPLARPAHQAYESGFIRDVAVVYENGMEHAENVELHLLDSGQMLLAFRGGGTGQPETPDARIRIFRIDPLTYQGTLLSEVAPPLETPPRGIRDPKLFEWQGRLKLSAISREAGFPVRDLFANARTVIAESADGGASFSPPLAARFEGSDDPTFGIWRYAVREQLREGRPVKTLYATGYNDGDLTAAYFSSQDGGATFKRLGNILASPADVPSEAELIFTGPDQATAVSLVRLDNKGLLSAGQTAVCTQRAGPAGFSGDFECARRLEQRLDGPSRIFEVNGRRFVAARKHLACTRKRTALYEIRGELSDPRAPVSLCEIAELPSAGDTAYAAVAAIPGRRDELVLAWYSSPLEDDLPWLAGQLAPSWILAAHLDFKKYDPSRCVAPPPAPSCPPASLPPASATALDGAYLLRIAPSFLPTRPVVFEARAHQSHGVLDLTLQGLDQEKMLGTFARVPIGEPFSASGRAGADGVFELAFGSPRVPSAVYPVGPRMTGGFVFERLVLRFVPRGDGFCGGIEGDVLLEPIPGQVPPGTRLLLEGSTFEAGRYGSAPSCR
jgi:hypothetical protein